MFTTKFGTFDGNSWELLCQQVFKKKYMSDQYQTIPASPGDFGLEGFTLKTGLGFQCYCPDTHYTQEELYEKQRDKITRDLNKLKVYQKDLQSRLGANKLSQWIFVTPEFAKNDLLKHVRKKENEVRGWKLPILTPDFCILIHDGDDYATEINEIRAASGEVFVFDDTTAQLAALTEPTETYEENILRKSKNRLATKTSHSNFNELVDTLCNKTLKSFLDTEGYFRKISDSAPKVYFHLIRLINEYEQYVIEFSLTWTGTAEQLTKKVQDELAEHLRKDSTLNLTETDVLKTSRHMVARWLAICELDYD